ncbi:MAG: hypothetical protein KDA90_03685 [Planctomycetaceae bacterium]|nr:hypothetical protein [Planctomycetaceae bacterium]
MVTRICWTCVLLITANTALVTLAAEPTRPCVSVDHTIRATDLPAHCERVDETEFLLMTRSLLQQHQIQMPEVRDASFSQPTWGGRWSQLMQLNIF